MKKEDNSPPILEILDNDYLSDAETTFSISDCSELEHGAFLEGKSTATWYPNFEDDDFDTVEVIAEAKVASVLHQGYSPQTIELWLDNHSDDFNSAGALLCELLDWDSESLDEEIKTCTTRIIILEKFEVKEKYRNKGLGKFLARKILYSAAAKGECVVVQPDLGKENGNEPERLIKFWLGLDKGMKYSAQFNTIYTSIFD